MFRHKLSSYAKATDGLCLSFVSSVRQAQAFGSEAQARRDDAELVEASKLKATGQKAKLKSLSFRLILNFALLSCILPARP